jgi:4-hydroxy-2-oxoheptanedioate aldolase
MRPNRVREIWQQGGLVVNGWLQLPHGYAVELMAEAAWDSLTIDLQHGPVGYEQAVPMFQAISTTDKTPLARVPWNEPGICMKLLDAGCYGLICPMINTEEECRRFVGAVRYPPFPGGYRSFGPNRARIYGGADYASKANETLLALAMIETRQAVENLEAILDVPGLDGVYVGPADLAQSYGRAPTSDHTDSEMLGILETIAKATRGRGLGAGIHIGAPSYTETVAPLGYNFVTIQSDARLLSVAAAAAVAEARGGKSAARGGLY